MRESGNFIEKMELDDLPMVGRSFTRCNSLDGERWSRIDRFLIDPRWLEKFKFQLWGLPRDVSVHYLILLRKDGRNWGPRPFRFLNAWTLYPNFLKTM